MASTSNSQAIGIVNSMIDDLTQLYTVYRSVKSDNGQWNNLPNTLAGLLEGFSTSAVGPDGQLGTADAGAPSADPSHVIDTRVYSSLSRALAQADIASLNTFFGAFINLMEGAAVSQQGQAPGLIAKIIGS